MSHEMKVKRKQRNPMYLLFIVGFLAGVLVPNLMWRQIYMQSGIVSTYLLECLGDLESEKNVLLWQVLRKRAGLACLTGICGISIFGVFIAAMGVLLFSFEIGSILTCSILQFGVQGGLLGSALLMPHCFFYAGGMLGLGFTAYQKSLQAWRNESIFQKDLYKYIGKMILFMVLIMLGVIFETYCSPEIVKIIIKNLEIF